MISKAIRAMAATLRETPQHAALVAHSLDVLANQMEALEVSIADHGSVTKSEIDGIGRDVIHFPPLAAPNDAPAWEHMIHDPT